MEQLDGSRNLDTFAPIRFSEMGRVHAQRNPRGIHDCRRKGRRSHGHVSTSFLSSHSLVVLKSKSRSRLSQALKQTGYAWSNSTLDSLILSLDSHVAAFRLASNPSPPTSTSYPTTSQFTQSTDSFDFDPSLSLFANLTAISTPSGSSNDYSPVENVGRPTSSQTGCAPGRESGAKNGLDELSQVLGLY